MDHQRKRSNQIQGARKGKGWDGNLAEAVEPSTKKNVGISEKD